MDAEKLLEISEQQNNKIKELLSNSNQSKEMLVNDSAP